MSFLKQHKLRFATLLLVTVGVTVCQLLVPQFFNVLIDDVVLKQKDSHSFYNLAIILVVVVVILIVFRIVRSICQRQLQERVLMAIQMHLFKHVHGLGIAYFESHNVGDSLASLTTEVEVVSDFYRNILPKLLFNGIYFIFATICMLVISVKMTMLFLLCVAIYIVIWPFTEKKRATLTGKLQKSRKRFAQKIYGCLSSFLEVRAYHRENWVIERIGQEIKSFNSIFIKTQVFKDLLEALKTFIMRGAALAVFAAAFYEVKQGELSIGNFTAYIIYFFSSVGALTKLISQLTAQYFVLYQAKHLYDLCHLEPMVVSGTESMALIKKDFDITFKSVSFTYGRTQILRNINITLYQGERIAFVGYSGCGKSTILKLIARFYDPTEGQILLGETSIKAVDFNDLREFIGYLFQENFVFSMSILDNIKFGKPNASFEEVVNAAKMACIHDDILSFPSGYDTKLGEQGNSMSGGQKQRIAIARLLLKNPKIVILDEATSALDNKTEEKVTQAMNQLFKNRTVIAVAHRFASIKDYDRIVLLEKGEVAQIGTFADFARPGTKLNAFSRLHLNQEVN